MVFDTLFALDADGVAQHQMLASHTVDAGQTLWTLTLRDGLLLKLRKALSPERLGDLLAAGARLDAAAAAELTARLATGGD